MADGDFEKTEQATPRKRQEARERGQVARSREIPAVAVMAAAAGVLYFSLPAMASGVSDLTREIFLNMGTLRLDKDNLNPFVSRIVMKTAVLLLPVMTAVMVMAAASNIAQFGFLISGKAIEPKFSRINPWSGIKRIFSLHTLGELIKSVLKIVVVGTVAYWLIRQEFHRFPSLEVMAFPQILDYIVRLVFKLFLWTLAALFLLSGLDYAFQRWEHEKSLRMTREEIREEYKRTEGDPAIKARIRSLQREMAKKRMMAAVPKADVVVTNPVHLAVAVSYVHGKMNAPKVVAKGAGFVAEKIKETAKRSGVAIVENKPLARMLYKTVGIGEEIPAKLYKAVAEVLAYVYRLRKR
ncbi:MAG: flagellar biosynthesis protein FlhB [Nitrospirae bacterium]|nr:flagellar biosynthesis protein FlhB [Nitrospirota bacterium]